jgi:hypothetical protein
MRQNWYDVGVDELTYVGMLHLVDRVDAGAMT